MLVVDGVPRRRFTNTAAFLALALALVSCSSKTPEQAGPSANTAGTGAVTETGGASSGGASSVAGASCGGASCGGWGGAVPSGGTSAGDATAGSAATNGDTALFVPDRFPNNVIAGEDVALDLVAFTLQKGPTGRAEFYAAVKNVGLTPICKPGMLLDFFDNAQARVGSAGITLGTADFDRLSDGTVVPCVLVNQIAMGGSTMLPPEVVVAELGHFEYSFPAFAVTDLVPVPTAPSVGVFQTVRTLDGTAYTGELLNPLDAPVPATVSVFPVNAVGRPLGMATASDADPVQPGDAWSFQTSAIRDPGVAARVYPAN